MASMTFLKGSCSFESCSFQAIYINSPFFWTQQEAGDSFHAQRFRPPTFTWAHTHTHTLSYTFVALWTVGSVVIYSPCCHKPSVSFNNFHNLSSSLLLFVSSSQLYGATPQATPSPPAFRPDCSTSTPGLSFWWMIWAMTSVVSDLKKKKKKRYVTVAGMEVGYQSY